MNSSMSIENVGTVSYSSDKKQVSVYASQSNSSSAHKGAGSLFKTPLFSELVAKQTSGSVNYLCAGVIWDSQIAYGSDLLSILPLDSHYPGWSASNRMGKFSITSNNNDISKTLSSSATKINIGIGGYTSCTRITHTISVKIR